MTDVIGLEPDRLAPLTRALLGVFPRCDWQLQ